MSFEKELDAKAATTFGARLRTFTVEFIFPLFVTLVTHPLVQKGTLRRNASGKLV